MRMHRSTRTGAIVAGLAAMALTATACGSDDGGSAGSGGDSTDQTITLGFLPSWTDGLSTAYLWKNVLESEGYTVELTEVNDPGPLFAGVAGGDVDVYPHRQLHDPLAARPRRAIRARTAVGRRTTTPTSDVPTLDGR